MWLASGTFIDTWMPNPAMITDCFGAQRSDLSGTEILFVKGLFALLKMLIPIAFGVYVWTVCRFDRSHRRTSLLGLQEDAQK